MLVWLIPEAAAMLRVLQCVAFTGFSWVVFRMTCWISLAGMLGVRPGRGASFSRPAKPARRNRARQRAAFLGVIFKVAAISRSCLPSAASSTMRERSTRRAGSERARARCSRAWRCSVFRMTGRATRMLRNLSIVQTVPKIYRLLFTAHYTSNACHKGASLAVNRNRGTKVLNRPPEVR